MVKYTIASELNCKEPKLSESSSILFWLHKINITQLAQLFSLMKAYSGILQTVSI
jgi:hypothetical protein